MKYNLQLDLVKLVGKSRNWIKGRLFGRRDVLGYLYNNNSKFSGIKMSFVNIKARVNKKLLPIKAHYFFFNAGKRFNDI